MHWSVFAFVLHRQVAIRKSHLLFLTPQLPYSFECLFFSIVCRNYKAAYAIVHKVLYEKPYCSV